jgi:hypothetical protein
MLIGRATPIPANFTMTSRLPGMRTHPALVGQASCECRVVARISEFTVKNHMRSFFSKLYITNRAQAARLTRMTAYA